MPKARSKDVPGGVRQKPLYFQIKLDLPSLPENKNLLFAAQKQFRATLN
jgi:hypothetical protein